MTATTNSGLERIWEQCQRWDLDYEAAIRRTNGRSPSATVDENRSGPGAAGNSPGPGQHPPWKGST